MLIEKESSKNSSGSRWLNELWAPHFDDGGIPVSRGTTAVFGDRAFDHGDWLARAGSANWGIFGNSEEEALYPFVTKEANGTPLDASKHNYTFTFAANQFPPVQSFWSLTMYDPKTQHLIQNPINRYLLNSAMLPSMKKNPDGSLTLLIQKDSPGKAKEANWLPAPHGPI